MDFLVLQNTDVLEAQTGVSIDARRAIDELLATTRRDGLSADDVADRLEMVAYFHRELLHDGVRDWVADLFCKVLREVEAEHRESSDRQAGLAALRQIQGMLGVAMDEIRNMMFRTRELSYSLSEGTPLIDVLAPRSPLLLIERLPNLSSTIHRQSVYLARAETRILLDEGISRDTAANLLGIPPHRVDAFSRDA